jgi:hypothetical protein
MFEVNRKSCRESAWLEHKEGAHSYNRNQPTWSCYEFGLNTPRSISSFPHAAAPASPATSSSPPPLPRLLYLRRVLPSSSISSPLPTPGPAAPWCPSSLDQHPTTREVPLLLLELPRRAGRGKGASRGQGTRRATRWRVTTSGVIPYPTPPRCCCCRRRPRPSVAGHGSDMMLHSTSPTCCCQVSSVYSSSIHPF